MLSSRKRRRKTAGRRVSPFIPMPKVLVLTGSEWQPFLELLPSRPRSEILRDRLNELLVTYLGYLDGEARSPSSREVAKVLHDIARRANQFAKDLFLLERRAQDGQDERFNTPDEVASRILTSDLLCKTLCGLMNYLLVSLIVRPKSLPRVQGRASRRTVSLRPGCCDA